MKDSKDNHVLVLFLFSLAFAESSNQNFLQNLQRNVDEYRTSHFSWNIQNLDHANYKSLRAIEDYNDRAFREYLLNHSPKVKHLLAREHVPMDRNITNGKKGETPHEKHQMIYNKMDEQLPQTMEYAYRADMAQLMPYEEPLTMVYTTNDVETARLKKRAAELPQTMPMPEEEKQQSRQKREVNTTSQRMAYKIHQWVSIAGSMAVGFPKTDNVYFNSWNQNIVLFGNNEIDREEFENKFQRLPLQIMLEQLSLTDNFQHIFWPFNFDQAFMNQRLALLGMSGLSTIGHKQKEKFYAELEKHQTVKIPVEEGRVILSFNHPDLVEGLNRSGLLEMSKEYVEAGRHLYTLEEQGHISSKVQEAMDMINSTNPDLYRAIHQVIGCIAFYKAEHRGMIGGTISSALGVMWEDARVFSEQTVAYYAAQIVHEFIHSSLFLADMVHGTYIDRNLLPKAKVYSPVRKELRDFDKTFHASYVTTGVTIFQSRAGDFDNAEKYTGTLRAAVDGLIAMQKGAGVLNASGEAMLQAMDDVLTLIRMK